MHALPAGGAVTVRTASTSRRPCCTRSPRYATYPSSNRYAFAAGERRRASDPSAVFLRLQAFPSMLGATFVPAPMAMSGTLSPAIPSTRRQPFHRAPPFRLEGLDEGSGATIGRRSRESVVSASKISARNDASR